MGKGGLIRLVIGVLVLILAIGLLSRPDREPEYGGKKLSQWLKDFDNQGRRAQAEEAVILIGTNAIPSLVTWIRYEWPDWKAKSYEGVNSTLRRARVPWEISDRKSVRAWAALQAFHLLGPKAETAIPALIGIVHDPSAAMSAQLRAVQALGYLGQNGLTPLVDVLRQPKREWSWLLRMQALRAIKDLGSNARPAVPFLVQCLLDPDASIRGRVRAALQIIDPDALKKADADRLGDGKKEMPVVEWDFNK